MRVLPLDDATPGTSGAKAATLATLRRGGIDVPDGFVIPFEEWHRHHHAAAPAAPEPGLVRDITAQLGRLFGGTDDGGHVAVRSSASHEDGHVASAAGQYDTFLAVRGSRDVVAAVARCWASLHSERATSYRRGLEDPRPPAMAVLVQRLVDPHVSGVLFTGTPAMVEATPGLGEPLVGGHVTPDAWTLDGNRVLSRRPGSPTHRLDRDGDRLTRTALPPQERMCLDDGQVLGLHRHGQRVSTLLGQPADVEWAMVAGNIHTLQARPITGRPPLGGRGGQGVPGSPGIATGTARVLLGPRDFARFHAGDILVCHTTDPAWTPLLRHASGVVTESGGVLSHAAIVARELGIPAVLGVPEATSRYAEGTTITLDGSTGRIATHRHL